MREPSSHFGAGLEKQAIWSGGDRALALGGRSGRSTFRPRARAAIPGARVSNSPQKPRIRAWPDGARYGALIGRCCLHIRRKLRAQGIRFNIKRLWSGIRMLSIALLKEPHRFNVKTVLKQVLKHGPRGCCCMRGTCVHACWVCVACVECVRCMVRAWCVHGACISASIGACEVSGRCVCEGGCEAPTFTE